MNTKNINPIAYFLIVFFFGIFGIHKFIDGKIGQGILYLFTCGLFGIGYLIDIVKSLFAMINSPAANTQSNNDFLLQWQKVVLANSPDKLVMSKEQLQDQSQLQANNDIRIIKDCIELINNTVNPEVFFSRLDLLKSTSEHLELLENYLLFTMLHPDKYNRILKNEQDKIYQFVIRYYNSVDAYAYKLKTSQGKINQYQKFYDALMPHKNKMNEITIEYIEQKYNQSKILNNN